MTFLRSEVVMLPTEKAENCLLLRYNRLFHQPNYSTQEWLRHNDTKSYHLYFLSDELTEDEVCWHYNDILNIVSCERSTGYKKIIAATDPDLTTDKRKIIFAQSEREHLPQPSLDFLHVYCTAYDSGKPIEWVNIEYNEKIILFDDEQCEIGHPIKINPKDNTITIRSIKNSWTREEHEQGLRDLAQAINNKYRFGDGYFDINEWIKQNL